MNQFTARRLPVHRGPAAWNSILGQGREYPALDGDQTADFVIIGGGFAGLSAARRLVQLQPGARVVLLEAGRIASGAAGRNSGFMIDLPHDLVSATYAGDGDDRALIAANRQAIAFGAAAVGEYGINPNYFDRSGKVNGAVSARADANNRSYGAHLGELGESSEYLDAGQMQTLTGSRHYRSGLLTPGTVTLQPAGYIRGLAAGLSDRVAIYENSAAVRFEKQGSGWRVHSPKGQISAGSVILAVNGHLESFGFERGRLMHIFLFASMTGELDDDALSRVGGEPRWGITPSDPMGTTMRRIDAAQGGNRIVTRTCAVLRQGMQTHAGDLARAARVHRRKFDRRFPVLNDVPMEYSWSGHLCLSLNSVSVAREIDDNVFSACVQNGLGTARGTLTGIAAAELACSEKSEITRFFEPQARPKKLAPQPFAQIGANAFMRLKEWRARDE